MQSDLTIHWYSLLLLSLPTIIRLWYDYHTIVHDKHEVRHVHNTVYTAIGMIVCSFVVWRIEPVQYLFQPFLLSTAIFVLFFDYLLNLLRGKGMFYIDLGTDGKQSFADSVYERLGYFGTAFFKLWWVGVCMGCYFFWSYVVSYKP